MSSAEPKSPDTLSAGPALDRAVAEVCGIEWLAGADYGHYLGTVRLVHNPDGVPSVKTWSPSTDWNDAMEAAERTVAIDDYCSIQLAQCERGDGWTCTIQCDATRVFAETGPLAICRAILAYRDWMNEKVANETRAMEMGRILNPLTYVTIPGKKR